MSETLFSASTLLGESIQIPGSQPTSKRKNAHSEC